MTAPGPPVALVTGGAGGFGRAFARRLAARGHAVVVADLDADGAAEVAAEVGGISIRADVSRPEDTVAAVRRAVAEHGRLDVVALNAGIGSGLGPTDPLDLEAYRRIVGVNQDAVVYGLDAAVPHLRAAGGGKVVVTASLAGLVPMPADPLYTLTKTAVVGYVRAVGEPLAQARRHGDRAVPGLRRHRDARPAAGRRWPRPGCRCCPPTTSATPSSTCSTGARPGEVWFVQPGREPGPYRFRGVPGPGPAGSGGDPVSGQRP